MKRLISKTAISIAPVQSRWRRFRLAETDASDHASAACYRSIKHIRISAVVVAELKFRDVQRHIFVAHFVECADNAALEDRPEAFNRVRVNCADDVLVRFVVNHLVRVLAQIIAVSRPRVRRQQADLVGNDFAHESQHCFRCNQLKNANNYISLTLYGSDDGRFALCRAELLLVPMAILVFAADPRFVHFHDAAKLRLWRNERGANFVAHGMGRLVAAEAHHALDLQGAHSLLAGEHEMGDPEPVAERLLGVLKNRPGKAREPIALRRTGAALPVEGFVAGGVVQIEVSATRAGDALRPTAGDQVVETSFVVPDWETGLKLGRSHLRDWFRTFCHSGHPSNPSVEGYCHV
jgi:hypothetical protein